MIRFNSLFMLPSIIFVFNFCRLTTAINLSVSSVKRGRIVDPIECLGPLPNFYIPHPYPEFSNLLEMCADRGLNPMNLGCRCAGDMLVCGTSTRRQTQRMLIHCFIHCTCGDETVKNTDDPTRKLEFDVADIIPGVIPGTETLSRPRPFIPGGNWPGVSSTASDNINAQACSGSCTSVNRSCAGDVNGSCKCYAPPVSHTFWHNSSCGAVITELKRDLAHDRRGYYSNVTAQYGSPTGTPPELSALLASGMLPSPCNASYVSFACTDSPDGIVHEPPQNWLGALLPENATEIPPVPAEFLRIHKLDAEKIFGQGLEVS